MYWVHEVLRDYYGFPEVAPRGWPNRPCIDRQAVGYVRFNAAKAAVMNSRRWLVRRGLLLNSSGPFVLTPGGVEVAKELLETTTRP